MTEYIAKFEKELIASNESNQTLRESMQTWLEVFKYPSVERSTYDIRIHKRRVNMLSLKSILLRIRQQKALYPVGIEQFLLDE